MQEVKPRSDRDPTPRPLDSDTRRAAVSLAIALAVGLLLFSAVFSANAPQGYWPNRIFGTKAWGEADPGAVYIETAHQLEWGEDPIFVGHPGTTLLIVLSSLQRSYYAIAGDSSLDYTQFTARRLPEVFVLSKLAMTVFHLLAMAAVYALARRLVRSERAAFFAMLGYATSLPVLFYLSRVSVEPLAALFFVGALLAVWRHQENLVDENPGAALAFLALAAFAAASAVVTKLNFFAPLPFFLLGMLLVGAVDDRPEGRISVRQRLSAAITFTAAAGATLLAYSQIIDWDGFFELWVKFSNQRPREPWTLSLWLPGFDSKRVFVLSELAYIAIGVTGALAFFQSPGMPRSRALWVCGYGGFGLLVFAFRARAAGSFIGFHYFFFSNLVVAAFFGHALEVALQRLRPDLGGARALAAGLLAAALVHFFAIWAVVDSRRHDVAAYETIRPVHELIAQLGPTERLLHREADPDRFARRLAKAHAMGWRTPESPFRGVAELTAAVRSLFIPYDPEMPMAPDRWQEVKLLQAEVAIVDVSQWPPRPTSKETATRGASR